MYIMVAHYTMSDIMNIISMKKSWVNECARKWGEIQGSGMKSFELPDTNELTPGAMILVSYASFILQSTVRRAMLIKREICQNRYIDREALLAMSDYGCISKE